MGATDFYLHHLSSAVCYSAHARIGVRSEPEFYMEPDGSR
jgi:hypothetical protein